MGSFLSSKPRSPTYKPPPVTVPQVDSCSYTSSSESIHYLSASCSSPSLSIKRRLGVKVMRRRARELENIRNLPPKKRRCVIRKLS